MNFFFQNYYKNLFINHKILQIPTFRDKVSHLQRSGIALFMASVFIINPI
ncbi:hypothetical protein SPHINGO8BC_60617 [Sphingobacterium multivorum]|uniref:Uncharacterized protein n=1 Tax=Sphingobacterium multivorum TaxID=28454 RepID=A0A654DT06_SPHMU|nr:hypothetical protein SPHINGO8BC_60617 [Sphingobacterium multivorum]